MSRGAPETPKDKANAVIDALLHSHCESHPELWLVDALLHAAVELDPRLSIDKFIRYNLEPVVRSLVEKYLIGTPVTALIDFAGERLGVDLYKKGAEMTLEWLKNLHKNLPSMPTLW